MCIMRGCRSVTMDAWNVDQLKKMQCGGNGAMNDFFAKYGVEKDLDIRDKYNSSAAEFYRELIKARAEGRQYTPPDPSTVKKMGRTVQNNRGAKSGSLHGRDAWGVQDGQHEEHGRGEYRLEDLESSAAAKDDFFARKQRENSMRPEGIPPSQGGKYVGFGSQPTMPQRQSHSQFDDVTGLVTKGFSDLSVFAKTKASEMNDALQEAGVAEKTKEYGAKGWSLLRTAYASAASTIEKTVAQQGYQLDLGSKKVADGLHAPKGVGRYNSIEAPAPSGHGFVESQNRTLGYDRANTSRHDSGSSRVSSRAPEARASQQGNLLDADGDDDWADWNQPSTVTTNGKAKQQGTGTGGWDGWDDETPSQTNGTAITSSKEVEKDDSWGTW